MQIVIVLSFFIALRLNQCLSFISIHCIHCVCATMRRGHLCNHQRRRRININCLCELCLVRVSNCENWRQTGHAIHWLAIWNSNSFFFFCLFFNDFIEKPLSHSILPVCRLDMEIVASAICTDFYSFRLHGSRICQLNSFAPFSTSHDHNLKWVMNQNAFARITRPSRILI